MEVKSKTRGGARCCICFDPFSIQNLSVIVFFCCHAYHTTCLVDAAYTSNSKRGVRATTRQLELNYECYTAAKEDDEDEDEDNQSGMTRIRCVLCTTASS
ncbi:hypothetical protein SLE2022_355370 [Rubroshorea leprosula]